MAVHKPWKWALLTAVLIFMGLLAASLFRDLARMARVDTVATRIHAALEREPRFKDAIIQFGRHSSLSVIASDSMPPQDKADLERLIAEQGKPLGVTVNFETIAPRSPEP